MNVLNSIVLPKQLWKCRFRQKCKSWRLFFGYIWDWIPRQSITESTLWKNRIVRIFMQGTNGQLSNHLVYQNLQVFDEDLDRRNKTCWWREGCFRKTVWINVKSTIFVFFRTNLFLINRPKEAIIQLFALYKRDFFHCKINHKNQNCSCVTTLLAFSWKCWTIRILMDRFLKSGFSSEHFFVKVKFSLETAMKKIKPRDWEKPEVDYLGQWILLALFDFW